MVCRAQHDTLDSVARHVRYHGDIHALVWKLTNPYTDDKDRARAIFIWITHHIAYDRVKFNKGKSPGIPDYSGFPDSAARMQAFTDRYVRRVLHRRKAVCSGYAWLFTKMCDIARLRSSVVVGYSKTKPYQVGGGISEDHAWNVIWLDGAWHFVDATWAAGGCDEDKSPTWLERFLLGYGDPCLGRFHYKYDEYYWLTPFDYFQRNHYPLDPRWAMLNLTRQGFADQPYINRREIEDLILLSPRTGVIDARVGDTLRFSFTYRNLDVFRDTLQVNTNAFRNPPIWYRVRRRWRLDTVAAKMQRYIVPQINGDVETFTYVVGNPFLDYIEVLRHSDLLMRFRIRVNGTAWGLHN